MRTISRRNAPDLLSHRQRTAESRTAAPRDGVILAAVVICLLVVMLMAATLVRGIVMQRQQARNEWLQVQAVWVAESAHQRATIQLRLNAEYSGETWQAVPHAADAARRGIALIEVRPGTNESRRVVAVTATWPDHPTSRSRFAKETLIVMPHGEE